MKYLIDFLENDIEKSKIFPQLKCSKEEGKILKFLVKKYINGDEDTVVFEVLSELFSIDDYEYIKKLPLFKNLLELGWIVQSNFVQIKVGEVSNLELLNSSMSLSISLIKLLEEGNLDMILPEATPYNDHLEYLKDQFFKIELYQKISMDRHRTTNTNMLKNKVQLLETRIDERIKATENKIAVEELFTEYELDQKEKILFLALLKEEYSSEFDNLREMNQLIDLISFDDYERIKNRALLEDGSKLIEKGIIDYDEVLTGFGGLSRSFFIEEDILQKIMHPNREKKSKKIKLDMLVKEQDIFELITPKTALDDVVLNPKTKKIIDNILQQMDKKVIKLLREWGIKEGKKGIDARLIFYGAAGTGKTMTAIALAKSLKKSILNFDCSKILSMYVGESEKNVRKIFDTYNDLSEKTKSEPVLLLNEADQFLSSRTTSSLGSADKMHNQMQNIFLEQIENFNGILIATTNLLESIDPAFSRRFDYKIEFTKPNRKQRVELWKKMLPNNAKYEKSFSIDELSKYPLTGGQIKVVIKNCAMLTAVKDRPIFTMKEFKSVISGELSGAFGDEKKMGFVS